MEIVKHGVEYNIENFESGTGSQNIRFTSKENGEYIPGTTNEEIIDMLIDRFYFLNKKSFSADNQCVILLLKNIRRLLKRRLSKKIDNVINYQKEEHGK